MIFEAEIWAKMAKKGKKIKNWNTKWSFWDRKTLIPKKFIEKIDFVSRNWGKTGNKNRQKNFK